jgi:hypothetical protein
VSEPGTGASSSVAASQPKRKIALPMRTFREAVAVATLTLRTMAVMY